MSIQVVPATEDRWSDALTILSPSDRMACLCLYFRLSSSEYRRPTWEERKRMMRTRLARAPAPGMLAYIGDEPVGWCGIGPRAEFDRLSRSRTIPRIDDKPVWSVVCFLVCSGFRRKGVARALLAGAIDYARREGAVGLEAYPVDPGERRIDTTFAYVGTAHMFESAGFRRVAETKAHSARLPRILMRLDLR